MATDTFQRKLTAILSADVVGYSRLMGEDEVATVKTLETYKGVMFSLIKQHRGRVVDSPGDNLLAEFGSVVDAVQCAVSIQKEIQTRNEDLPENRRMEFRIGINLGDVIEEKDRIYGDGVNIAARLESLADPGGICVSKTAFDHIESKLPLGYEFLGEQTVKNISKPVGAYKVLMETRVVDARTKREAKAVSLWRRTAVLCLGITLILVLGGILYWNFYLRGPSIEPASIERMAYPLPDKPSIAVLPFTNMSGDPEQDYVGDGLSENIISALSASSRIFVMARNSTFAYKGTHVTIRQVAEDLGVLYVLEGSIKISGDQLRVTAQLIDAVSGHHLWSDVYNREMKDLFELEDEITKKIVVSIGVELYGGEDVRVFSKSTNNLEAWKYYIKGDELFRNFAKEDNLKAREHLETALSFDPAFVTALSKFATAHLMDFVLGWSDSPLTSMNRAYTLAQKAVELDEQNPGAHMTLALVLLHRRQHEKAITEGKLGIKLNPNYCLGHAQLGQIMLYSGRFEEAISLTKKAYRLNPNLHQLFLSYLTLSYIHLGRYEEALETIKRFDARFLSGELGWIQPLLFYWVYQELGREEEARAYMAESLKIYPYLSIEYIKNLLPYKNPAHLQRILDACRKAGMPERALGAVQEKPSIAVLPFDDLSPEKDQEYFVLGLSEEILNSLCQIPGLGVTGKTSSFSLKDTKKTIQEIAAILGIANILEGSVRKAGDALRISVQLVRTSDGLNLWSETYDREFKDIFKIQEEIANRVADKLKLTLEAYNIFGGTKNTEAYENFLIAKGLMSDIFKQGQKSEYLSTQTRRAEESLKTAIALDPEFALAWAFRVVIYWFHLAFTAGYLVDSDLDLCLNAALTAIELEPNLPEAYYSLGLSRCLRREFIEAELAYRKAMELSNDPRNCYQFGFPIYSMTVGYFERANKITEAFRQIDPLNQSNYAVSILTSFFHGDMQRAEEKYEHGKAIFVDQLYLGDVGDIYISILRLGAKDVVTRDKIVYSNPIFDVAKAHLDSPKEGLTELHQLYGDNRNLSEFDLTKISVWAAYFCDPDFAMDAMEKGAEINSLTLFQIWYPVMHEVRQLPRFKEFVREIGLVDYWKEYGWPDLCRPVGDDDFVCD